MRDRWNKENLEVFVKEERSAAKVLVRLNLKNTGSNYLNLYRYVSEYQLDTSHWTGKSGTRKKSLHLTTINIDELLVENSPIQSNRLKQRLIDENKIEYRCDVCKITNYNNAPIALQLHHINGASNDNRLINLQLLCPNCHSQTDNYGGKSNKSDHNIESVSCKCKLCNKIIWSSRYKYCGDCWNFRRKEILDLDHEKEIP